MAVVLVGLDGLTVGLLRRALAGDAWLELVPDGDEGALERGAPAVVVASADAHALREAARFVARHPLPDGQPIATLAVVAEPPGSDAWFVAPAGHDVSPAELAQLVRALAATRRDVADHIRSLS